MRKQVVLSALLTLSVIGGLAISPVPAMAEVAQTKTIKVSGQVVDQSGEPLIGLILVRFNLRVMP